MRQLTKVDLYKVLDKNHLNKLSMLGALPDKCVDYLLDSGEIINFQEGEYLFSLNDQSDCFYIILKGHTKYLQPRVIDNELRATKDYKPGEQIGFVGMIGLHQRHGYAKTSKESYVLKISEEIFHYFSNKFPEEFKLLMINLSREMSREISCLDEAIVNQIK